MLRSFDIGKRSVQQDPHKASLEAVNHFYTQLWVDTVFEIKKSFQIWLLLEEINWMKLEWDKPYAGSCDSEFKQIAATANMFEVLYARQKQEAEDKIYFSSATSKSGMISPLS